MNQQPPFEVVLYGHPFPPIENDNKDYVPIWKQEVIAIFEHVNGLP